MYENRMIDYIAPCENGSEIGIRGKRRTVHGISPTEIVESLCLEEGASLRGALDAGKHYLGNLYKVPVRFSGSGCYLFPTGGIKDRETVWVFFEQVKDVTKGPYANTVIGFYDGLSITVPIGKRSLTDKLALCRKYRNLAQSSAHLADLLEQEVRL